VLRTEWLWAGAFSFAVSSSYLQAEELASICDVVVACLTEFARYMSGVGISGECSVEHDACVSLHAGMQLQLPHLRRMYTHLQQLPASQRAICWWRERLRT
jgi:hypothetical protein